MVHVRGIDGRGQGRGIARERLTAPNRYTHSYSVCLTAVGRDPRGATAASRFLLADPRFVLEPDLDRFVRVRFGDVLDKGGLLEPLLHLRGVMVTVTGRGTRQESPSDGANRTRRQRVLGPGFLLENALGLLAAACRRLCLRGSARNRSLNKASFVTGNFGGRPLRRWGTTASRPWAR